MELRKVKELIELVLTIAKNDDTGVTDDLLDAALIAGESVGMTKEEMEYIYACA